jgi:hypothetical protein
MVELDAFSYFALYLDDFRATCEAIPRLHFPSIQMLEILKNFTPTRTVSIEGKSALIHPLNEHGLRMQDKVIKSRLNRRKEITL